jgi:hypothetical protein
MPGWFDFINGQTLPASRVQEYLMDQSVMKFADSGSRAAALPFPTDGMVSYLTDVDRLFVYRSSSSAWVQIIDNTNFPTGNAVINGGFDIWQRGTSFTGRDNFTADRNYFFGNGAGAASTISRQTFTPGAAPLAGYEGQFFYRYNQTTAGTGGTLNILDSILEDVRTLAGQTVTLSFFAKADASRTVGALFRQNFGSGGSASVNTTLGTAALTTSWQRFSFSITMPSMSGKTIGANSNLTVRLEFPINTTQTIDVWGVQLEAGSVATPFARAAGTLQGELAACQRYYYRNTATSTYSRFAQGGNWESTSSRLYQTVTIPVSMRTPPASVETSNLAVYDGANLITVNSAVLAFSTTDNAMLSLTLASAATSFRPYDLVRNAGAGGFVAFSAEL